MEKKRNALIAAGFAALLSGTAKAHVHFIDLGYHSDLDSQTRWSIYQQGLISGGWKWSTHAGELVPDEVRYSPYAFSPSHPTGLVWDNGRGHSFSSINRQDVLYKPSPDNSSNCAPSVAFMIYNFPVAKPETKSFEELRADNEAKQKAIRISVAERKERIAKREEIRRKDPVNEIYKYLSETNASFKNHEPLILDGEVTGTTFFLDKKRVIQYVNIGRIKKQEGFVRKKVCGEYLDRLSKLAKEYTEKGWNIRLVTFDEGKINGLESRL